MEKRKVTISIDGKPCSLYSDDPEEYLSILEQRANAVMRETAGFSGSAYSNAVLSVITLTDELLRSEQKIQNLTAERKKDEFRSNSPRKNSVKDGEKERGQISVWDILETHE